MENVIDTFSFEFKNAEMTVPMRNFALFELTPLAQETMASPIRTLSYPECLSELTPALSSIVQNVAPMMQRIMLLQSAWAAFSSPDKPNYTHSEAVYHQLYEDIRDNPSIWFDQVFPRDAMYAEWTLKIVGTLATIRRQRGQVQDCLDILKLDVRVLKVYQSMVKDIKDQDVKDCCVALTYRYHLICQNAHTQAGNMQEAVQAFRDLARAEIENPENEQLAHQNVWLLQEYFDFPEYITQDQVDALSDARIWSFLKLTTEEPGESAGGDLHCSLRICDNCGDQETMLGNHKKRSTCKQVWYCSKKCQRKHWKGGHKHACGEEETCPVPNDTINALAAQLTKNYSKTVENHAGYVATEQQKKALFPGLVQFFKDSIKERPELADSCEAFMDAGRDKEFMEKVDAFFEQQDGFESLQKIHKTPHARACKERLYSRDREVRVDEDSLLSFAKSWVHHFASKFHEDVNESHHVLSIDVLMVELTKILLEYPKYNSYQGFQEMSEDPEMKTRLVLRMVEELAKDNPEAWVDQEAMSQKQKICVDDDKMVKLADCAVETVVIMLRRLGKLDGEPKRDFARDVVLLLIKETLENKSEYNSNETVDKLIDDTTFRNKVFELTVQLL